MKQHEGKYLIGEMLVITLYDTKYCPYASSVHADASL